MAEETRLLDNVADYYNLRDYAHVLRQIESGSGDAIKTLRTVAPSLFNGEKLRKDIGMDAVVHAVRDNRVAFGLVNIRDSRHFTQIAKYAKEVAEDGKEYPSDETITRLHDRCIELADQRRDDSMTAYIDSREKKKAAKSDLRHHRGRVFGWVTAAIALGLVSAGVIGGIGYSAFSVVSGALTAAWGIASATAVIGVGVGIALSFLALRGAIKLFSRLGERLKAARNDRYESKQRYKELKRSMKQAKTAASTADLIAARNRYAENAHDWYGESYLYAPERAAGAPEALMGAPGRGLDEELTLTPGAPAAPAPRLTPGATPAPAPRPIPGATPAPKPSEKKDASAPKPTPGATPAPKPAEKKNAPTPGATPAPKPAEKKDAPTPGATPAPKSDEKKDPMSEFNAGGMNPFEEDESKKLEKDTDSKDTDSKDKDKDKGSEKPAPTPEGKKPAPVPVPGVKAENAMSEDDLKAAAKKEIELYAGILHYDLTKLTEQQLKVLEGKKTDIAQRLVDKNKGLKKDTSEKAVEDCLKEFPVHKSLKAEEPAEAPAPKEAPAPTERPAAPAPRPVERSAAPTPEEKKKPDEVKVENALKGTRELRSVEELIRERKALGAHWGSAEIKGEVSRELIESLRNRTVKEMQRSGRYGEIGSEEFSRVLFKKLTDKVNEIQYGDKSTGIGKNAYCSLLGADSKIRKAVYGVTSGEGTPESRLKAQANERFSTMHDVTRQSLSEKIAAREKEEQEKKAAEAAAQKAAEEAKKAEEAAASKKTEAAPVNPTPKNVESIEHAESEELPEIEIKIDEKYDQAITKARTALEEAQKKTASVKAAEELARTAVREANATLARLNSEHETLLEASNEANSAYEGLNARYTELTADIESRRQSLQSLSAEIEGKRATKAEREASLARDNATFDNATSGAKSANEAYENKAQEAAELSRQHVEKTKEVETKKEAYEEATRQKKDTQGKVDAKFDTLTALVGRLEVANGEVSTQGQTVASMTQEIADDEAKLAGLQAQSDKADEASKLAAEIETKKVQLAAEQKKLDEANERASKLQGQYDTEKVEYGGLQQQLEDKEKEEQRLYEEYDKVFKACETLKGQADEAQSDSEKLRAVAEAAQETLRLATEQKAASETALAAINDEIAAKEREETEAKDILGQKEETAANMQHEVSEAENKAKSAKEKADEVEGRAKAAAEAAETAKNAINDAIKNVGTAEEEERKAQESLKAANQAKTAAEEAARQKAEEEARKAREEAEKQKAAAEEAKKKAAEQAAEQAKQGAEKKVPAPEAEPGMGD